MKTKMPYTHFNHPEVERAILELLTLGEGEANDYIVDLLLGEGKGITFSQEVFSELNSIINSGETELRDTFTFN
jgi:hypothetical protein